MARLAFSKQKKNHTRQVLCVTWSFLGFFLGSTRTRIAAVASRGSRESINSCLRRRISDLLTSSHSPPSPNTMPSGIALQSPESMNGGKDLRRVVEMVGEKPPDVIRQKLAGILLHEEFLLSFDCTRPSVLGSLRLLVLFGLAYLQVGGGENEFFALKEIMRNIWFLCKTIWPSEPSESPEERLERVHKDTEMGQILHLCTELSESNGEIFKDIGRSQFVELQEIAGQILQANAVKSSERDVSEVHEEEGNATKKPRVQD